MKKEIALSIEQMKHLQDFGLDCSGASMSYLAYKDTTDEWVEEEYPKRGHFKHDETSEAIISLELGYDKGLLYSDMGECSNYTCCEVTAAFCLQDILELLPLLYSTSNGICNKSLSCGDSIYYPNIYKDEDGEFIVEYISSESDTWVSFKCINQLVSSYNMLCWCIENGHVETNKTK